MKTHDITTKTKKAGGTLIFGVFLLTVSNLIVKVIGMLFKVPISYILKDEGMGYFNIAYTIYIWLYILSTAGVPVGVSILVSKANAQGRAEYLKKILHSSLFFFGVIGFIGSFLLIAFPGIFAKMVGSSNASYCVIAIAPALFFVAISSVLRGYFQGHGSMLPTAISQLLEAIGKLTVGILLATYAAKKGLGLPLVSAYAILGVSIGSFLSVIYLTLSTASHRNKLKSLKEDKSNAGVLKPLLSITLPITLSSCVMSITSLIDLTMIMRRLQSIGYNEAQAAALYGNYTTLVIPVFNLPSILIYPIACAIVPALSKANFKKETENALKMENLSLKITALLAFPSALGIGVFSYPILSSIFEDDSAQIAAPYLAVLSPAIIGMCLLATTNAILQARGLQTKPIFSMLIAAFAKIAVDFILIGREEVGMFGAAIGTVFFYFIATIVNFRSIYKSAQTNLNLKDFLVTPLLISVLAITLPYLLYQLGKGYFSTTLLLVISIFATIIIYSILMIISGIINTEEIEQLPFKAKYINALQASLVKFKAKKRKNSSKY